jgi:hypothetical protein
VALGITMRMAENHRSGFVTEQFIKHRLSLSIGAGWNH